MKTYFCSSDIHSFYDEWVSALQESGFDYSNSEHILIICGDLFDRGDKSRECWEFVKEMQKNNRVIYVTGNHEDLLFDAIRQIKLGHVGSHHISNGTIKTLANFINCSEYDLLCGCYDTTEFDKLADEIRDFIDNNCVDYFDLGDKVFVHGWVPAYAHIEDYHDAKHDDWKHARWENGFEMWRNIKCRPLNKVVVMGHWHCSYGWSHIDMKYKEFPNKNHPDFQYSFNPWINDGIIAIDACTAYTGKVNVVKFDDGGNFLG